MNNIKNLFKKNDNQNELEILYNILKPTGFDPNKTMKTTIFFLIFVIISPSINSFLFDSKQKLNTLSSTSYPKEIDFLNESNTGQMLLSLAQLHLQTEGAIDDLIQAITYLYNDLLQKISNENDNWDFSTSQHNQRVNELESNINYADSDVKTSTQKLENMLEPLQEQIISEITSLSEKIDNNRESTSKTKEERDQENEEYNSKLKEIQDCITACEEAIGLVNELINSTPSLLQIRKAKSSVSKIQKALGKNNQYSPLIKALTQLALDQNFSDQETVQKIIDLLSNLKENLDNSLESLNYAESKAQTNYKEILTQYSQELAELKTALDQRELDSQTAQSLYFFFFF